MVSLGMDNRLSVILG